MTDSTQNTNATQQTQSQTNPWAPLIAPLTGVANSVAGLDTDPTAGQRSAAYGAVTAAKGLPNFGGQVGQQAGAFLGGDPFNILNPAYQQYQKTLSPFTDPNNLDPSQNPATANLIQTLQDRIRDQVNQQFAGAGRDLSGMNSQALGRGEMQGLAPTLFGQYNQNVANLMNAGSNLFGAAGQTNSALGGNVGTGAGLAAAQPGIAGAPAQALLSAQNQQAALPYIQAALKTALLTPLAGLGGQTSGTANTNANTTLSPSLLSSIYQGAGLFGTGTVGGNMLGSLAAKFG